VILEEPQIILISAAALDYLIGDPWNWIHPVQVMGWFIAQFTRLVFRGVKQPIGLRVLGAGMAILLILGSGIVGWAIVELARVIHPILGSAIASILLASCFAGRSLRKAAAEITHLLAEKKLEEARSRLSLYVGRDTEDLSESEILRAVLETVTENAVDGVMSPLFYAIVGMFLPVGSVAFALVYKASSTLDSMIGYREAPYTDIGWFSAKTDDVLTWLPCRLTVFTLGAMSGRPFEVWKLCRRDAPIDPSPNSGWSECVYAAVLGVQVGGVNRYKGVEKQKPLLGEPSQPITIERIQHALSLTRWCFLVWIAIAIGLTLRLCVY
jgi:adenosylcobinamide-phosphate synthase